MEFSSAFLSPSLPSELIGETVPLAENIPRLKPVDDIRSKKLSDISLVGVPVSCGALPNCG